MYIALNNSKILIDYNCTMQTIPNIKPPLIETEQLIVRLISNVDASLLLNFFDKNKEHLKERSPTASKESNTLAFWIAYCKNAQLEFQEDRTVRLLFFLKTNPEAPL